MPVWLRKFYLKKLEEAKAKLLAPEPTKTPIKKTNK
jgi:hypothetical protein